jgi:hypothetical protein
MFTGAAGARSTLVVPWGLLSLCATAPAAAADLPMGCAWRVNHSGVRFFRVAREVFRWGLNREGARRALRNNQQPKGECCSHGGGARVWRASTAVARMEETACACTFACAHAARWTSPAAAGWALAMAV